MTASAVDTQQLAINTIRTLSMDAVQQANSGHPGTPMALAPVVYALWTDHLGFDPVHPKWIARDRFVLSCGHASMLLYSILHLTGVAEVDSDGNPTGAEAISLDDIRNFRQLHSPCAGHPEYGEAAGIETTTGPLGQGVGNSVGMAIAARWMAARYNREGLELFGNDVYALCSDGDIMEGVACEAASLAGHLGLSNLCWVYDDNQITIEGRTELAFSEDVAQRFAGLGWSTITVEDANDVASLDAAFQQFKATGDRPTLIIVKSIIGYGAPNKQDTAGAHGSPLGEEEIRLAKQSYGWPADEKFQVSPDVKEHFSNSIGQRGAALYEEWSEQFENYKNEFPELAAQVTDIISGRLPAGWEDKLPAFEADKKGMATRVSSGKVLNAIASEIPWLIGGSADLAGSNKSLIEADSAGSLGATNPGGRNFHFGIREHGMAAVCNGLALSGMRAYAATFFVFTDYMRPSMRLSALMRQPVVYILTHDSIGLGEDGPTHQPVEHLAACRAIPNLLVMRPADANEVTECYRAALRQSARPTALILTRQNVPTFDRTDLGGAQGTGRGGYILVDSTGTPDVILIGSGSEIALCVEAATQLMSIGLNARVVSMPCWELFNEQDAGYREQVLPAQVSARVGVEAGIEQGWRQFLGDQGEFVGMSSFGASAPYQTLYEHFGITVDSIVTAAQKTIKA